MGTGSFPGVKRPGRVADHPPPSKCRCQERVGLYLYSPSRPSWPVMGAPLREMTDEKMVISVPLWVTYGIRLVKIDLNKHIPSQLYIGEFWALISYVGQLLTCFVCNAADRTAQVCSRRAQNMKSDRENKEHTWVQMVEIGSQMIHWHCRAAQLNPCALYNPETTEELPPKRKYESFTYGRICTATGPEYDGCRVGGWVWCTRAELNH